MESQSARELDLAFRGHFSFQFRFRLSLPLKGEFGPFSGLT